MAETDPDGSLDPLEAEVERDRADLLGTVEALRLRLSSEGVGAGIGRRVRAGASAGVVQRVRDHPLEAVALGAGVAYPVLRIASKIPAPILLLGAGVALAGRGGAAKGRSGDRIDVTVVEEVEVAGTGAARGIASGGPRVSTPVTARAGGSVGPAGGGAAERASAGGRTSSDRIAAAGRSAAAAGRSGQDTVIEAIQRHPGAAAGLGLLIGGALAAMLPRSRAEDRAFGEAGEEARARARTLALDGIESARRVARAARDEAEDQDLTPEGARHVAEEVRSRARKGAGDMVEDVSEVASKKSE